MAFGPQGYNQTIASIGKQGTLYNTFTTAKSMLNSATSIVEVSSARITLPPGFFYMGKKLKIRGSAGLSNIVTTPGTFTCEIHVGPTANIIGFTTGAMLMTTTSHVNIPVWFDIDLVCDTAGDGTLAKLRGQSRWSGQGLQQSGAAAADTVTGATIMAPNTAPALGTGFDSTVSMVLDFFIAFSISQATNGFQLWTYEVIDCN